MMKSLSVNLKLLIWKIWNICKFEALSRDDNDVIWIIRDDFSLELARN